MIFQGNSFFEAFPLAKEFVVERSPEPVKKIDGAIERACCAILTIQALLLGAYAGSHLLKTIFVYLNCCILSNLSLTHSHSIYQHYSRKDTLSARILSSYQ